MDVYLHPATVGGAVFLAPLAPPDQPATITSLALSPSTASTTGGGQVQFTTTVTGTGDFSAAVTYTAALGTISAAGLYTAPPALFTARADTITATSNQDPTKSATALVAIAAAPPVVTGITVTPSSATLAGGAQVQLSAAVIGFGDPSQAVGWTAPAGTVSSTGLYIAPVAALAPQDIVVTATSLYDPTKSGTAAITVLAADIPPPDPTPRPSFGGITVAQFRIDYPEFADVTRYPEATIERQLRLASILLGEMAWGDLWGYGIELRAAHYLTVGARNAASALAGGSGGGVAGLMTSKSVDKVSASYDVSAVTNAGAGFWNTTGYGVEFYALLMTIGAGPVQL
jgi:hypothetical protein